MLPLNHLHIICNNIYTSHTLNEENNTCICNKNKSNGMNVLFAMNVSISLIGFLIYIMLAGSIYVTEFYSIQFF